MSLPFHTTDDRAFYRVSLSRPGALELPFRPGPYPVLLWDHKGTWTDEDRETLSQALIATDCRYAVCGGLACDDWHHAIDMAYIEGVPEEQKEARFIMTTSHTSEPPLEVAWFFVMNTNFDDHDFKRFLLLELGPTDRSLERAIARVATDPEGTAIELDPE